MRWLLAGGIAAGAAALLAGGGLEWLRDPEGARAWMEDAGPWGRVAFVLAFALLEPLGVPGVLFMVPAAALWPAGEALLLSWLGAVGAGVLGAAAARHLLREAVAARLPPRFRRYDARLARRPLTTVLLVRLAFFLAPPAHWALGLSAVPMRHLVVGTALGLLPGVVVVVLGSRGAVALAQEHPAWAAAAGGGALVAALLARRAWRARRARRAGV